MNKKKVLLIVIGVLLIVSVSIGLTYAYYMATVTQNGENVVKTDCFEISYADKDEISLSDSFPMRDADGANLTPYEFTIKNVCSTTQYYEVNLETLSTSTIDESKIKVKLDNKTPYLYGSDGYTSNKIISSAKNAIKLASGTLTANQEKTYDLRLWLDESVTTDTPNIINKTFQSKVTIFASQNNRSFSIAIQRNNSTIKEDRVQGTKLDGVLYEYDLSDTDITNATNISCNEDATATIEDNKLKISNMHENTICKINDTLKSTIDNLDDSLTNIKMIKNEDNVEKMTIGTTNDVVLDLNGKEINSIGVNETDTTLSYDTNYSVFKLYGKLTVNDLNGNGKILSGVRSTPIVPYANSTLIINNGNYQGRDVVTTDYNNTYMEVNNGSFVSLRNETVGLYSDCQNSKLVINGGTFLNNNNSTLVYSKSGNNSAIIINGGTFINTGRTIENKAGTININGGSFESTGNQTICNAANGTININDNNGKVYLSNFSSSTNIWASKTIMNYGNGTINISGHIANRCTENDIDTTSGICIYANNGRALLNEYVENNPATGIINVDGAYIVSKNNYAINNYDGTINIRNTKVSTLNYTSSIYNSNTGNINICSVDLLNNVTIGAGRVGSNNAGYIYYATNAFGSVTPTFTGTTANIQIKDDVCN